MNLPPHPGNGWAPGDAFREAAGFYRKARGALEIGACRLAADCLLRANERLARWERRAASAEIEREEWEAGTGVSRASQANRRSGRRQSSSLRKLAEASAERLRPL